MTARRVTVIGGGLAGLAAAATAARAGAAVTLLEARSEPGGRARTEARPHGARFNEGPHALYAGLAGTRVLAELDVAWSGGRPAERAWGRWNGRVDRLPGAPLDALRTRLVGLRAKRELARLLVDPRKAAATDQSGSYADWIARNATDPGARALLTMVGRTATYAPDPARIAAAAAVPQVVAALTDGVRYLDGGWGTLVDGLRRAAEDAGAKVVTGVRVTAVGPRADGFAIEGDVPEEHTDRVVLALGGPRSVAGLLGDTAPTAATWAASTAPVTMASLDLHLRSLPRPQRRACFALDAPIYLSAHTPFGALAEHGEVVHVAWYGAADDSTIGTLEGFLDEVQPGWRAEVLDRRYGRALVTTHGLPDPERGFAGRPDVAVPDLSGCFVAGDWVGREGILADAALASGARAGAAAAR